MKVITEDESGGKLMLEEMNRLYFYGVMKIDSFKGIPHLYRYIKDNEDDWTKYDKVVVIYDDAPNNPNVANQLRRVRSLLSQLKLTDKIQYFPIVSFEYEILTTDKIEIFAQIATHEQIKYFREIGKKYGTQQLYAKTRNNNMFSDLYMQLKQQAENKLYKELGYIDNKRLMHHITFEKMCKLIFANAFKHELFIDNDFRGCWNKDCCIKNKRNCNIVGDINLQADIKKSYLLQYSIYGLMADMISGILGIENEIVAIDMVKIEKQCFFNTYHQ